MVPDTVCPVVSVPRRSYPSLFSKGRLRYGTRFRISSPPRSEPTGGGNDTEVRRRDRRVRKTDTFTIKTFTLFGDTEGSCLNEESWYVDFTDELPRLLYGQTRLGLLSSLGVLVRGSVTNPRPGSVGVSTIEDPTDSPRGQRGGRTVPRSHGLSFLSKPSQGTEGTVEVRNGQSYP